VEEASGYDLQGVVSAMTALGWVFLAYLFTIINTFMSLQPIVESRSLWAWAWHLLGWHL
jgi:hypothetical protein